MSIILSWGRYGGFYITRGRVCLGWVAITWLSMEIDALMRLAAEDRGTCELCGARYVTVLASASWHDEGVALRVCEVCESEAA